MTDLERLTQTLDALNIHYGQRPLASIDALKEKQ